MFPPTLVLAAGLLLVVVPAIAQTTPAVKDDPPPKLENLAEQLEELAEIREKKRVAYLDSVRKQLLQAVQGSGTAGNFMIDCMREVRFGGTKNANSEFNDWKKENRNLYTNTDFEKASGLHLKYLLLTLERGTKETSEPMIPKVWAYIYELAAARDLFGFVERPKRDLKIRVVDQKQDVVSEIVGDMTQLQQAAVRGRAGPGEIRQYVDEMLTSPVDSGFPGQALKLQGRMGSFENWSMVPGDLSAILEQNIRPFLRENKDAKLPWTWDFEVDYLRAVASVRGDERATTEFETETVPRLMWKKADDMELIGMPNKALTLRLEIAKNFQGHNDFPTWAETIESKVSQMATAERAAEEEASADSSGKYNEESGAGESGYFGSTRNPGADPAPPLP